VGLMLLLGLKAMGVSTVYMTEVMEYRRKKAEELGAAPHWSGIRLRSRLRAGAWMWPSKQSVSKRP
jgi:hypothetical protein